jgi:hypothetical protein
MHQLSIFETSAGRAGDSAPPRARREDPPSSQLAAAKAGSFAATHRERIFAALEHPGTIKELAMRTGMDHVAIARRMKELQNAQRAVPTDDLRDGCRVWRRA